MTRILSTILLVTTNTLLSQVSDQFTDGDFTSNPAWSGDDSEFTIDGSNQLRLNNLAPSSNNESYLSLVSTVIENATWEFKVGFDGLSSTGLSGSNKMFVYLVASKADLKDDPTGYYVMVGNTDDEISLYSTASSTPIINGTDDVTQFSSEFISVRITRDAFGNWELLIDTDGGSTFTSEGTANNTDFTESTYFGVLCDYTSTRNTNFFFDDFNVTGSSPLDTNPPTIQSVTAISDTQVDVTFNEPVDQTLAETSANYAVDGGISVNSATRDAGNTALVHLTTGSMTNGTTYSITINNIEDESGNAIIPNSQEMYQYLVFEEAMEFDVVINEFMPDPNPVIALPDAEYVELYNRSSKFINLENWELDGQVLGSFQFNPDSYVIVVEDNDEALFSTFSNVIAITTLSLNNSSMDAITLEDDNGVQIHNITFEGSTGGMSIELINPNGPDYSKNNYGFSIDLDGGTPGQQNSIFDDTPDTTSPAISSITVISNTELDVNFNEPIDETTSESTGNYTIDGGITVSAVMRDDTENSIVYLTVSALVSGDTRTLTINGVEDLSGNVVAANSTIDFEYIETEEAIAGDVLINEFYAIPSGDAGIPNTEFVELLNVSNKFIDLENWTLSDASNTSSGMGSFMLRPDSYVILTETDNGVLFSPFGDVVEIGGFPALNNGGDALRITNASSIDIFSISYASATSGVSTELINPYAPDFSENNYGPSIDPDGGTPGEQNSIFDDTPDTTKPTISELLVISSTQLKLIFSEPITSVSAVQTSNYSIDGGITVTLAQFESGSNSRVDLAVSELVSTEIRILTINNVQDLSGNVIDMDTSIEFIFIETVVASPGDVLVNEFMANPLNEGGTINGEFIELLNNTQSYFDLENWTVSDASGTSGIFPSKVFAPNELLILVPDNNPELYAGLGEVLVVPGFRSLNNSSDDIALKDGTGTIIFELSYTSSELGKSAELINPNDPCISESSYNTSAAIEGRTPGQVNSVFDPTPDTEAPTVISTNFNQSLTINFSEVMDASSLTNGLYKISNLTVSNTSVGLFPTSLDIFFTEDLQAGMIYEMNVSNVTDCWGNPLEETQVNFGIGRSPSFNEVLITEILSDPDPSIGLPEAEFIEIYNNTGSILNTVNLMFSDANSSVEIPPISLFPNEYYVLTSISGASSFTNVNVIGISGFPSLSNVGEQLYLSLGQDLIFSVFYSKDWHDDEKSDGGYSLEMKDITNPCVEAFNWGSSSRAMGGTPGEVNSVSENVPDNFGPEVIGVVVLSANELRVDFNENIDPDVRSTATITFEPNLNVSGIDFYYQFPKSVIVRLSQDLIESKPHTFQLRNVFDCNGNEVQESDLVVVLPVSAVVGDILLSEVLFNPRANGVDFVELYNASTKYIDLEQWQLARITAGGVSDEKSITDPIVIRPGAYFAFTTDVEILFDNYPQAIFESLYEISSLPTYANDTGNVVLLSPLDEVHEFFHYEDDFHYDLLESSDGVSLERISFTSNANDPNNWRSASSVAGFATPGGPNSQSLSNQMIALGTVEAVPKVVIPGNSGSGRDFTTINYQFEQPGKFANITIYDQTGRVIKNVAEGALLSTEGFVRWDGTTNSGEMARIGYYVVLFEVFDSSGNSDVIKETVVIGRDF